MASSLSSCHKSLAIIRTTAGCGSGCASCGKLAEKNAEDVHQSECIIMVPLWQSVTPKVALTSIQMHIEQDVDFSHRENICLLRPGMKSTPKIIDERT